jgi:hypothetical protein
VSVGAYKNLCAILETTTQRKTPLEPAILGKGRELYLAVVQREDQKILASVPFEPGQEDEAAEDVARMLTLDGGLPPGMA